LSWQTIAGYSAAEGVQFDPSGPQEYAPDTNFLFNLQALSSWTSGGAINANSPGARIMSAVSGVNDNATGLTINVANTLASATGVTEIGAELYGVSKGASGSTAISAGLSAYAGGHGTNYPALFTHGSVGIGTSAPLELLDVNGNIRISGVNGLRITEGSNATMGVATLSGGTIPVSTTKVTANSNIFLTDQTSSGTPGTPYVSARNPGTNFTIKSTSGTDGSTVAWWIVEPPFVYDHTYTSSSTLVVPAGVTSIRVTGYGGAGGGGGGGAKISITLIGGAGGGGGGGAGGFVPTTYVTVHSGETLTITVGAAGTAGTGGTTTPTNATNGGTGGTTTISGSVSGTIFSAVGGTGGTAAVNATGIASTNGGALGAGGTAPTTPAGGIAGISGTAGTNGTTSVVSGGTGGSGPGSSNTGGAGGTGFGTGTLTTKGNGGAGTAGAAGSVEISY
jgi:hypothetical protein